MTTAHSTATSLWEWLTRLATGLGILGAVTAIPVSIYSCNVARSSERFNVVSAEVQWQSLRDGYDEIDAEIATFEKSTGRERTNSTIETRVQLDEYLAEANLPGEVNDRYVRRFERWQALRNAASQYAPFKNRVPNFEIAVPPVPVVPRINPPVLMNANPVIP